MPNRWMQSPPSRRWIIAALFLVLTALYGELCLQQSTRAPDLGLQTAFRGEQLVVFQMQPAGLAWAAGIRPGDQVIASAPSSNIESQPTTLTVLTPNGERRTVSATPLPASDTLYRRVSFLIIATSFVIVGAFVFLLGSSGAGSVLLLGVSGTATLGLLSAIATPTGAAWALAGVNMSLVTFSITLFLLFVTFSYPKLEPFHWRFILSACAGTAVLLLAGYAGSVWGDGSWYDQFRPWLFGCVFLYLIASCVLALGALARPNQRRSEHVVLRLAVLGVCAGVAPFALLVLLPDALGIDLSIPPEFAATWLVALPVSLALAVLTQQRLEIERFARRSVVALTVWGTLLVSYGLSLNGLRQQFPPSTGIVGELINTTIFQIALVAGTFPLVQHGLRRWLERRVFDAGDHPSAQLQQLRNALIQTNNIDTLASIALPLISSALYVPRVSLELTLQKGTPHVYTWSERTESDQMRQTLDGDSKHTYRQQFALSAQGEKLGFLYLECRQPTQDWSPEAAEFIDGLLPLLAVTLHNALLLERLQQQVVLLSERERDLARLSARLLETQEDERRRLAFDLHDDPLQRAIVLERALAEAPQTQQTQDWRQAVFDISTSLRAVCASLRPAMLDDLGLLPALSRLVYDVRARSELEVDLQVDVTVEKLPITTEHSVALFRIAQEALNNAVKHAQATHVSITITAPDTHIELRVTDDGQGFQQEGQNQDRQCFGIAGMRERLRPFHGNLQIFAEPGCGTTVIATVPMQEETMTVNQQTPRWRILIVDDHPVVLDGTTRLFAPCEDFAVVGTTASGKEALQLVSDLRPDLLILDIRLPDISGIEVARTCRAAFPNVCILVVTGYDDAAYAKALASIGIHGMISKTSSGTEIVALARKICAGEVLPIAEAVGTSDIDRMTGRERTILALLVAGRRNKEIADHLQISVKTVEFYVSQLLEKLSVRSRAEAVGKAVTLGLTAHSGTE